jgi:hypothetical protein
VHNIVRGNEQQWQSPSSIHTKCYENGGMVLKPLLTWNEELCLAVSLLINENL